MLAGFAVQCRRRVGGHPSPEWTTRFHRAISIPASPSVSPSPEGTTAIVRQAVRTPAENRNVSHPLAGLWKSRNFAG